MALHGINMAQAMEGQEAIWQKVWLAMGISQMALDRHFTGPAQLPWHRKGIVADDPEGVWVMQAWICRNDPKFWDDTTMHAFLKVIPDDRLILLDKDAWKNPTRSECLEAAWRLRWLGASFCCRIASVKNRGGV
jgi:hypothetical protein